MLICVQKCFEMRKTEESVIWFYRYRFLEQFLLLLTTVGVSNASDGHEVRGFQKNSSDGHTLGYLIGKIQFPHLFGIIKQLYIDR